MNNNVQIYISSPHKNHNYLRKIVESKGLKKILQEKFDVIVEKDSYIYLVEKKNQNMTEEELDNIINRIHKYIIKHPYSPVSYKFNYLIKK